MIILDKFGDRRQSWGRGVGSKEQSASGVVLGSGRVSHQPICGLNFRPLIAFLPGSVQYVENDVTHSKQTTEIFLLGATTSWCRERTSIAKSLSNRERELLESELTHRKQTLTSRSNRELSTNPRRCNSRSPRPLLCINHSPLITRHWSFLTGSDSQTELAVTHSKQKTGIFLTGARTLFRNPRNCVAIKENF